MRWLVLFALLVVAYLVAEAGLRRLLGAVGPRRREVARPPRPEVRQAELVPCAACGLHVDRRRAVERPLGEATVRFCSAACAGRGQ